MRIARQQFSRTPTVQTCTTECGDHIVVVVVLVVDVMRLGI